MATTFTGFMAFAWVVLAALAGAFDGLAIDSNSQTAMNNLIQLQAFSTDNRFNIPLPNMAIFTDIYQMLTFNYNFFTGDYQYLRWLLVAIFTIPTTFFFISIVVPATMTALGFVRRVFP